MLKSVRHITFLYTLSNRDKMPSPKCELKLEMDVNSCHFETRFMEDSFESQIVHSHQLFMLHVTR